MRPLPVTPRSFFETLPHDSRGVRIREDIRAAELLAIGAIEPPTFRPELQARIDRAKAARRGLWA